jgi:hypothetical protein
VCTRHLGLHDGAVTVQGQEDLLEMKVGDKINYIKVSTTKTAFVSEGHQLHRGAAVSLHALSHTSPLCGNVACMLLSIQFVATCSSSAAMV